MAHMQGTLDISIRVSRMGQREEASETEQEARGRELAKAKGYEVGEVITELNVSGGKKASERQVERLIQRIESGESKGIVVYDFSRLTREDAFAATMLVGRIHLAGGVVFGVADNYDSSAPMAAVMTALYAEQAHAYLKTCRERSNAGRERAKARGAYNGRTIPGYTRNADKSLSVNETEAAIVRQVFAKRLAGESYYGLAKWATAQGLAVTDGGIRTLLRNAAYVGRSELGQTPAIVDVETFEAVQKMTTKRGPKATKSKRILTGLVKCANCGEAMVAVESSGVWYCRGRNLSRCEHRGSVSLANLEAHVESIFLGAFNDGGPLAKAYADQSALRETGALLAEAQAEYETLKGNTKLLAALGDDAASVIDDAKAKVEMAEVAYADAKANADTLGGVAAMLDEWHGLDVETKRRLLASAIESVNVKSGRASIADKVQVIFTGGVVLSPNDAVASLTLV